MGTLEISLEIVNILEFKREFLKRNRNIGLRICL